jgi:hypothetical protein
MYAACGVGNARLNVTFFSIRNCSKSERSCVWELFACALHHDRKYYITSGMNDALKGRMENVK